MLGKISRLLRQQKGFTLVELMAVIVIIGVLAAIAIPVYNNVTTKAAEAAHAANIRILAAAGQMAVFSGLGDEENVTWTGAKQGETWGDYLDKWPEVPAGANIEWTGYKVTIEDGVVKVGDSNGEGTGNGNGN